MKQREAAWKCYRHENGEEVRITVLEKETKKQRDGRAVKEAALEAAGFKIIATVDDLLEINKDVK